MTSHDRLVAEREARRLGRTPPEPPPAPGPTPDPPRRQVDRSKPNVALGIPVKSG